MEALLVCLDLLLLVRPGIYLSADSLYSPASTIDKQISPWQGLESRRRAVLRTNSRTHTPANERVMNQTIEHRIPLEHGRSGRPRPGMHLNLLATLFILALSICIASLPSAAAEEKLPPTKTAAMPPLVAGDALWIQRANTLSGNLAAPAAIEAVIERYEAARRNEPSALEPHWKLLRALHYSVDFTDRDNDAKQASVNQAIALAHESTQILESGKGSDRDRARLYFWSGIAWGTKAGRVGLLTIVREGLATRMHDFAESAVELDPSVDQGGALRLLSRLHATLPRVPFVSGWVDRTKALGLAERALALDPDHPGNKLVMALALLELKPNREREARAFLEGVASGAARAEYLAEDLAIKQQAASRIDKLNRETK